jgi:hypothetical protein
LKRKKTNGKVASSNPPQGQVKNPCLLEIAPPAPLRKENPVIIGLLGSQTPGENTEDHRESQKEMKKGDKKKQKKKIEKEKRKKFRSQAGMIQ